MKAAGGEGGRVEGGRGGREGRGGEKRRGEESEEVQARRERGRDEGYKEVEEDRNQISMDTEACR